MIKKILITIAAIVVAIVGTGVWFFSLLPESPNKAQLKASKAADIPYIQQALPTTRGKILAVVTSVDRMGSTDKATGYEFTELSRPYWVFTVNGLEVDIASIKGGQPPVVLDDMSEFDYAFLNDELAMSKLNHSMRIEEVNPDDYQAVFFVGGKGAMFDFPDNKSVQHLVKTLYQNDKVVAAVCHGPAALTNVTLDNGQPLLAGKQVSSFTNEEELILIPDAEEIFPFLLENQLKAQGATFIAGTAYLEQVSIDGKLLTGQNPWSTWQLSEDVIRALGYQPVERVITKEEHAVDLLTIYHQQGLASAKQAVEHAPAHKYSRMMIAMHSLVAIMRFDFVDSLQLMRLTSAVKARDESV